MKPLHVAVTAAILLAGGAPASAQGIVQTLPAVALPSVSIMLPNYNGVGIGEVASLEANAAVVRAADASATWYNPAGLALAERSSISGSAGAFQFGSVSPDGVNNLGSSFQQVPASIGVVLKRIGGQQAWTGGFQITHSANWNHEVDLQRTFLASGLNDRATYSSASNYGTWIASAAAGYSYNPQLRVGGSLDFQLTEFSTDTSASEQDQTATALNALLVQRRNSASAVHMRFTVGAQYDLSPALRLGAVIRTPGIGLWSGGSYFQEGQSHVGGATTTASFFDPATDVTVKLPAELKLGAAYVHKRGEIEINLLAYTGTGTYFAFTSAQPLVVTSDAGLAGPPVVNTYAFNSPLVDSGAVLNVAIGGVYHLTENGVWDLHAGFATDGSPVDEFDTLYTNASLQAWTAGVSARSQHLLTSFGFRYESGESGTYALRTLQNGQTLSTKVKFSNFGLLYSLAFRF